MLVLRLFACELRPRDNPALHFETSDDVGQT